jgi:hypothetical protein
VKPNAFPIDPRLGPEDALTAYWHYVLSVVPGHTGIAGTSLPITLRDHEDPRNPLLYAPNPYGERTYHVPLDHVLRPHLNVSERRLVRFVQTAVGHLRDEVAQLSGASRVE